MFCCPNASGGFDLSAMLGGAGGFGGPAAQPVADPETAYASQLTQLQVQIICLYFCAALCRLRPLSCVWQMPAFYLA